MKKTKITALISCCLIATPTFAAPTPIGTISTTPNADTLADIEGQCADYLAALNTDLTPRVFSAVSASTPVAGTPTLGAEVGPRVNDESTRAPTSDATALSYSNVSAAGATDLHRHGGSPNIFATGYAGTVQWSNTTVQFTSTYGTSVVFTFHCSSTEQITTPVETVYETQGQCANRVAQDDAIKALPEFLALQGNAVGIWCQDLSHRLILGTTGGGTTTIAGPVSGDLTSTQLDTIQATDIDLNAGPATLQSQHYPVDVVVCNSPGKNPGSWRAQNLYGGGSLTGGTALAPLQGCNTYYFNSLPNDGHFSSNSLPLAT